MDTKKPKILIVNDDGINAPGIYHLWKALVDFADVSIVAPATEQSGKGLSTTLTRPLLINTRKWEKNTPAWSVNGTPADCIKMALSVLLQKPDLIVSGINRGANSGRNVLYSGTIGGVIEGVFRKIPGIAFSCIELSNPQYDVAEKYVVPIVDYFLNNPLPQGSLINVSVPSSLKENIKGIKLAKQGRSYWLEKPDKRVHPEGHFYYWLGSRWMDHDETQDTDIALLNEGYVTAVPIHIDELTDHSFYSMHKDSFNTNLENLSENKS